MADDDEGAGSGGGGGGTVKLPGVGTVKKTYVYIGAALVVGIVGYAWWARSRAGGADELSADELPMAEIPAGTSTTPGLSQNYDNDPPDPSTLPPTTNDEWSRRAVAYLRDELYYDPATAAAALGKYLSRLPLVPAEQDIVRTALGVLGKPPQGEYSVIPVPNPPAGGNPDPDENPLPTTAVVKKGWNPDQWMSDLNAQNPGLNLAWERLESLNPGISGDIEWHTALSARKFKYDKTYRVR
jgi:hypothetical protein